jgi:AsmA-like C-terminal region
MRDQTGFWWKCRVLFRQFRRAMIFAALVLICAILWLEKIGLPDFLKQPLVETLRARGVELKFTRLRLSLVRGLVADNVRIGRTEKAGGVALSLQQAQLRLNYHALLHGQLQIDGLVLRQGKFVWPLSPTNTLVLDHVQADLRFQANDTWSLDNFQANFAGAKLSLSGDVAHALALRNWEIFHGATNNAAVQQAGLQKIADALRQIHFTGQPQLSLTINGDARDPHSFLIHATANIPNVDSSWGLAQGIQFAAKLTAHAGTSANSDPSWAWWTNVQPYQLQWTVRASQLKSEGLNAHLVSCSGFWRAPELAVTNLSAKLGGGQLNASARLDVGAHKFTFTNSSRFDLHAIAALLTPKTRDWLTQFSWRQPPSLHAGGSLILPAWTNRQPDWRGEVQPTVSLAGEFIVTNGAFRDVAVDSARGHFSYSNLVWQLPDLIVTRPEGSLALANIEDDSTKNYHWHLQGVLNPKALQPLLTVSNAEQSLKLLTFTQPLFLDADVWGRLYDYDSIGATGRMALTNFTIRGETVGSVESAFRYTNRFLEFFQPQLQTGAQKMTADGIAANFNSWRIYFTNGVSTADPGAVTRAIGPKVGKVMAPYHFGQPCNVRVNGYAPLRNADDADLKFDVDGAPLEWLKLTTPCITGNIHWLGQTLILTNLTASFYGGDANGSARFDFRPKEGADFEFVANVKNADMHRLAADLSSPTNHLEGVLGGRFVITSANSKDWRTWNGYGRANLHDGLIWDVPIFGIVSPVLNTIAPGLGSSRATDATARFTLTNGVAFSDDLEIRSTMVRLQYLGTVDLQSRVNEHVTAQLLRDTWVVGPLISTALWPVSKLFEYKITGTLQKPNSEPVYVPKYLLMPLHPVRSLEEILSGGADTNTPPLK